MKKVFVFFPYLSMGEIHPWIENQVKGFKKAGFQVRVYPQKKSKNLFKNLLNLFFNLPKVIINLVKADFLLLSASLVASLLTPFFKILAKQIILTHVATVAYPSSRVALLQKNKKLALFFKKLDSLSYQFADYLFTYAYSIADKLVKVHQLDKKKVHIIETLVDTKLFAPVYAREAKKLKKKLGIADKDVLLYHGQYHPWHGLEYFFKAVPLLLKKNPNFVFIIMGDTKEYLKKIYPQEKILEQKCFYFPGQMAYQDLPKYLQLADLWFGRFAKAPYPSLGNCVVEALACAKPVILYKTWEHTRLLIDKKDAIFVKANDSEDIFQKITYYFKSENRKKLSTIGKNARKVTLRNFSIEVFAQKLKKILD